MLERKKKPPVFGKYQDYPLNTLIETVGPSVALEYYLQQIVVERMIVSVPMNGAEVIKEDSIDLIRRQIEFIQTFGFTDTVKVLLMDDRDGDPVYEEKGLYKGSHVYTRNDKKNILLKKEKTFIEIPIENIRVILQPEACLNRSRDYFLIVVNEQLDNTS